MKAPFFRIASSRASGGSRSWASRRGGPRAGRATRGEGRRSAGRRSRGAACGPARPGAGPGTGPIPAPGRRPRAQAEALRARDAVAVVRRRGVVAAGRAGRVAGAVLVDDLARRRVARMGVVVVVVAVVVVVVIFFVRRRQGAELGLAVHGAAVARDHVVVGERAGRLVRGCVAVHPVVGLRVDVAVEAVLEGPVRVAVEAVAVVVDARAGEFAADERRELRAAEAGLARRFRVGVQALDAVQVALRLQGALGAAVAPAVDVVRAVGVRVVVVLAPRLRVYGPPVVGRVRDHAPVVAEWCDRAVVGRGLGLERERAPARVNILGATSVLVRHLLLDVVLRLTQDGRRVRSDREGGEEDQLQGHGCNVVETDGYAGVARGFSLEVDILQARARAPTRPRRTAAPPGRPTITFRSRAR
mmetsp:Transcript_30258/g.98165  ORF Transcript_30258/g.98165 Transcript_30258/m.98165 type:complete len:416 (-) Transcript_30258:214-1461(-)